MKPDTIVKDLTAKPLTESEQDNLSRRTDKDLASHSESRHPENNILQALALKILPVEVAARILKRLDDTETQSESE